MIRIDKLGFAYGGTPVLKNITMTLEEGRIYGLLGENGVGKTTLLTLLCGLKKPMQGTIDIDGYTPYDRKPSILEKLFYLSDEVAPLRVSASDFAADRGRFWSGFDADKFNEIMDLFETGTKDRMDRMSNGQLKKTWISFALACNTHYLFMDEPTNGLDIPSKAQFRKAVTKYTREDSTLLISTHQVRDLENIIDPIIILDRQDVLLNASVADINGKLFFDYGTDSADEDTLYRETVPGGSVSVRLNTSARESKIDIEALFNAVHCNKELFKTIFSK